MKKVNEFNNEKNLYNVYEDGDNTIIEITNKETGIKSNKNFEDDIIAMDYITWHMCNC